LHAYGSGHGSGLPGYAAQYALWRQATMLAPEHASIATGHAVHVAVAL
jgi:hypothetical protein